METREEKDSLGTVAVPAEHFWGAQTQRSLENFAAGSEKMPLEVIYALALSKKASARVNSELGLIPANIAAEIERAADEVCSGELDGEFPLSVWQTGSGTQTNMNVNEVLANRAILRLGGTLGSKTPVHPNDHVNRSQSSNDIFPTAMHVAAAKLLNEKLLPSLTSLENEFTRLSEKFSDVIKIGRTHLMDATPLTVGQEFSGYAAQLRLAKKRIEEASEGLLELAVGGTAVGTGINAPKEFGDLVAKELAAFTGLPFRRATNSFEALSASDAIASASGALRGLASALMKIANDIRWSASGPRCGIGELKIPENEPGSSIMPGKVNPTQCEALTMIAVQVLGNDAAMGFAASQGNFQLNVYRPMMIHNLLQSITLLAEGMEQFSSRCITGLDVKKEAIDAHLQGSLMLATALNKEIGYDGASSIVRLAHEKGMTLKEAALELKIVDEKRFDEIVDPKKMI